LALGGPAPPHAFLKNETPMSFAKEDVFGMFALTAATEITLPLDVRYAYKLTHTGKDAAGNDDAQSALSAWLSTLSGTITCDNSIEDEKYELTDGGSETFGPGIGNLYVKSTTGADGVIKLFRIGTPTNSY
jgi:hypothetical protein